MTRPMVRDRRLVYTAVALRSFGYGFTSVLLGLYLEAAGFSAVQIGVVLTLALAGGALLTLGASLWADRLGRRRFLSLVALLAAGGGVVFFLWPHYAAVLAVAIAGTISPTGKDRGSFTAIEQSVLPQTGGPAERNWIFARYNLVGTVAGALGALAAGLPALLQRWAGLGELPSYRAMFLLYSGLAVVVALLYARLSPTVEPETVNVRPSLLPRLRSRRTIGGLAGLFALDAFGGGLVVQSFLSYWFHLRFGLSPETLGTLFFVSGILSSLSFLVAARLAQRIGLLNTMVFTHLPSNVLLALVPLSPAAWGALGLFLAREALSQMDVPTRQSYTVAVVAPEERTAAAGLTTLSRNAAQSLSPALGGYLTQAAGLWTPFVMAGVLKGLYDAALYVTFRHIKPPEEALREGSPAPLGDARERGQGR